MLGLSALDWSLLAVAALLVGFAKTAIGGVASISIAIFAAVLPAKESTGALLPLLVNGLGEVLPVRLGFEVLDVPIHVDPPPGLHGC